ncbi:MAG: hypothetical protein GX649_18665 [Chloroflexi bacterium]|nr:hypothetical protein [Chloroflexota bacterium]
MSEFAHAALNLPWMLGLALALAGCSLRRYLAAQDAERRSEWTRRVYQAGFLLVFFGLVLVSPELWRKLAAGVGALLYAGSLYADRHGEVSASPPVEEQG